MDVSSSNNGEGKYFYELGEDGSDQTIQPMKIRILSRPHGLQTFIGSCYNALGVSSPKIKSP